MMNDQNVQSIDLSLCSVYSLIIILQRAPSSPGNALCPTVLLGISPKMCCVRRQIELESCGGKCQYDAWMGKTLVVSSSNCAALCFYSINFICRKLKLHVFAFKTQGWIASSHCPMFTVCQLVQGNLIKLIIHQGVFTTWFSLISI